MEYLDKTSMFIYLSNPNIHFFQNGDEVEMNENCEYVEGWIKKEIEGSNINLEDLSKVLKNSIPRMLGVKGYRLDDCEITKDMDKSYVSFYAESKDTMDAFNGADYIVVDFDDFYVNIGR